MNIRVACVGAGYFSQFHYGSWARMDRVTLVGSCNREISKAQATGLPAYDDLDQMLTDTTPDLLDIILPPVAHAETIRTALAAGVKTIICQKPFCNDLAEAEDMTALAESAGARIIVHENFRFQPWYRAIKVAIDDGAIGTVQQATFRLRPGDGQGPRAYLDRQPYFQQMEKFLVHETAVHFIDTFRYLLGDPKAVYADLRKINPVIAGEDAGYILFDHSHGARAIFDGNRHLDHAAENTRCTMGEGLIEGTEGTLTLTGDGAVQLRKYSTMTMKTLLGPNTREGFGGDCVHSLQSHVICGILDGTKFENEAREYLQVIRIEEAIYASADKAQKLKV
ncbi:Gfo/Idh/MocA family protein [Granulosicoccus antarcticus]|uniref:Putative oxidoreductase YhhX n=1 Tax=Granulosicoccus antarcticus IMCC3135 TaxID=1192854 RepID=A0A2Z2NRL3_9GAMM|nr:Gfo/Idh/MocA family oxidoreductase [Granulosicoccus antarcticus]ASJ74156.1 putative oxidoreductase YhhX [Granulosicoccus antarcticus IMCC3135]